MIRISGKEYIKVLDYRCPYCHKVGVAFKGTGNPFKTKFHEFFEIWRKDWIHTIYCVNCQRKLLESNNRSVKDFGIK